MYVKSRFFLYPSYVSFYRLNLHEHINVFTRVIAVETLRGKVAGSWAKLISLRMSYV